MGKMTSVLYTNTQPVDNVAFSGPLFASTNVAPSGLNPAIVIAGSHLKSIKVSFLLEGYIKQLVVKQTSGSSCDFTVELLASSIPYPPGTYSAATDPAGTIELFRIVPQQTGTSGNASVLAPIYDLGFSWRNLDSDLTNVQRFVYLIIIPTSASGSTTWDAMILAESSHI